MSARESLIAHTASLLWRAWTASSEDMGSEAAATLHGLGMLVPEGGAAELERLRLLTNVQPAHLTEAQVEALADAGNRALNDHYHDELCHCSAWPESCVTSSYAPGRWDTGAFEIGMAAVIGLWESMRAPAMVAELVRLRARVAELEAERVEDRPVDEDPIAYSLTPAAELPHEGPEPHAYRLGRDLPDYWCNREIGHPSGHITGCNRPVGHDDECSAITNETAEKPSV
ncbi:hypothetical protein [Streptomyces sp. NPDC086023]|uniref:hypothetical protein n=1 Tax=Streptomyces sp. NPDC086023 TaxID=3365746 RepID=UPI0037CFC99F